MNDTLPVMAASPQRSGEYGEYIGNPDFPFSPVILSESELK